ncbi:GAF domain-containing protein [Limibaculum sp. M0105]|uniref:GAF domain-containing protein n=1 Tax=Thermohalobaculum xanthum TaxID=2753746 RepID=A0A8J7SEZ9_9RHOB|nr:GAF domain-containing protein [Thermohalobaculum xanthum]MBK0400967.1 GAF domain-containing protein [Thermohalobaculum xanthum]
MIEPSLDVIRNCFEGVVPAILATCDGDGVPNVSLVSQVHYVDCERVALSYQFFNKTRRNILSTGMASVSVMDPETVTDYRLDLFYEETQSEGPLFEIMKAKLAGIASHSGMEGVFQLLGADIFHVRSVSVASGPVTAPPDAPRNLLSAVRRSWHELGEARELGALFDRTLDCLGRYFSIEHAIILVRDGTAERLYTVASMGYARSGIGSEIALGHGVIGVAAREGVPIRIGHMSADYSYGATLRDQALDHGLGAPEATQIPYPGLPAPESQIAVPVMVGGRTAGVLFAESPEPMRFRYDDEDALSLVAARLGELMGSGLEAVGAEPGPSRPSVAAAQAIHIRHYAADNSVFVDHDYLIKGVAGAIFWKLVAEYDLTGRTEFTNRELRLDPALRLPEFAENLEARLVLLQRRLCERDCPIRLEKAGRGRLRLCVPGTLSLEDIPVAGGKLTA